MLRPAALFTFIPRCRRCCRSGHRESQLFRSRIGHMAAPATRQAALALSSANWPACCLPFVSDCFGCLPFVADWSLNEIGSRHSKHGSKGFLRTVLARGARFVFSELKRVSGGRPPATPSSPVRVFPRFV